MVFAQEIIGRPFITILGIKATTMVWVLIAVFLGLIFTMTIWPNFWKRYLHKPNKDDKSAPKWFHAYRFIPWQIAVMIMIIAVFGFLAGTFVGFSVAIENAPAVNAVSSCIPMPCSAVNLKCPNCHCEVCGDSLRVTIPAGG